MSFFESDLYEDRFNGSNKTVFRGDELVYTVNPEDPMSVIGDEEWYDRAVLQTDVWVHNIEQIQNQGINLTFDSYNRDMMFYEVADERINGKWTAPAIVVSEFEQVEPYSSRTTFEDIPADEENQIKEMQKQLDELIENGLIAVKERECTKNDFRGPSCLRQFGRNDNGNVFLLEFGEYHPNLEGPHTGREFLEEYDIEEERHGIGSPIILGDMSSYAWE